MQITFRLALSYVLAKFTTEKSKNWFPRDSRYSPLILRDPSNLNRKKKKKKKSKERGREKEENAENR